MSNELKDQHLGFIGSGRIASVFVERLLEAGALPPEQVTVSDIDPGAVQCLVDRFAIRGASGNAEVVEASHLVVLAVPPKEVLPVLRETRAFFRSAQTVVSLAAAVPTLAMEEALDRDLPVVRVIPNIPSLVGQGTNPFCRGRHVDRSSMEKVERLLEVLGTAVEVQEEDMPVVTALTGMGPTYVLPILQALIDSAVESGLDEDQALRLAARTFQGTAALVADTGRSPRELRKLIPAATKHDEPVSKIYSETLTKIVQGLRSKEAATRTPMETMTTS